MTDSSTTKHFFISYASADQAWAAWIAWILEDEGYSTVLQLWDFKPGSNFVLEMQKASTVAERTVIVLSESFLNSQFTQSEWAVAFARDPQGIHRTLVPIRVEECDPRGLLGQIVYIDFVALSQNDCRAVLLDKIRLERLKPREAPTFPGSVLEKLPRNVRRIRGRFLHERIVPDGLLEIVPIEHPYRRATDPTDNEQRQTDVPVSAFVWFPHPDKFKPQNLSAATPVAAFCTGDPKGAKVSVRESASGTDVAAMLAAAPASLMNQQKELVIAAIESASRLGFVAAASFPKTVVASGRNSPEIPYQAMTHLFLGPLLEMHRQLEVPRLNVAVAAVGDYTPHLLASVKKAAKGCFGTRRGICSVTLATPEDAALIGIARFVAWALGSSHNSNRREWVDRLEGALK